MMPDLGDYVKSTAPVILSGIINTRRAEVEECISKNGYTIVGEAIENDWVALLIKRA
jgi:ribosomal protein L11 methylase PrmA